MLADIDIDIAPKAFQLITPCSTLEKIQPRVVSFEEQVTFIRESLAGLLEQEEEWTKAAQILAGIDLDSGAVLGCMEGCVGFWYMVARQMLDMVF